MKLPKKTTIGQFTVETWFDRKAKVWTSQLKDGKGNQIGDAEHSGNRAGAEFTHTDLVKQAERANKQAEAARAGTGTMPISDEPWPGLNPANVHGIEASWEKEEFAINLCFKTDTVTLNKTEAERLHLALGRFLGK